MPVEVKERLVVSGVEVPRQVLRHQGDVILRLVEKLVEKSRIPEWVDERLAAEIYYSFYLPIPVLRVDESTGLSPEAVAILQNLIDNYRFWKVKPVTSVDRIASSVAAASFIEKVIRNLPGQGMGKGSQGKSSSKIAKIVSSALEEAEANARTAKRIESIVYATIAGSTSEIAFEDVLEAILRLAKNTDVDRVLERVSGVRIPARALVSAREYRRGWSEGVEYGSDLERLHYTMLALPDDVFYVYYAESRLLLYRKILPLYQGPVYVLMDKSGSMSGAKIDWARAVAVALLMKAVRSRRPFYARFFDASPYGLVRVPLNPKPKDIVEVLEYLGTVKAGGGTDITRALVAATDDITRRRVHGRVDIVLITDGEDQLSPHVIQELVESAKVKLHTVMIGGDNKVLRDVSASYMKAEHLSEEEILRIVEFVKESEDTRGVEPRKP